MTRKVSTIVAAGAFCSCLLPVGLAAQERQAAWTTAVDTVFEVSTQAPLPSKVRMPLEARVVTGAPYCADVATEHVETLADGNRIVQRTSGRVCRDAQGRTRREENGDGSGPPMIFITDPVAHVSYTVDPTDRVVLKRDGAPVEAIEVGGRGIFLTLADQDDVARKREVERQIIADKVTADRVIADKVVLDESGRTTVLGGNVVVARDLSGPGRDQKVEKLPSRDAEGVMAEGTRTTRTIPAGTIGNERPIVMTFEEWRSPDLQVLVSTTTSDPRSGDHTYKLENIVKGEPDPSLFQAPAGYTVKDVKIRENVTIKREPRQP